MWEISDSTNPLLIRRFKMKRLTRNKTLVCFCFAILIFTDSAFSTQLNTSSVVGNWMSKPGQFKVVFRVLRNEDGEFIAYTDIPDQEAWSIPTDLISSDGKKAKFDIYNIRCIYEGKISENGRTINGEFSGPDGGGMPLVLERVKNPPVRTSKRPQEPQKPYPYQEEIVSFENKLDKFMSTVRQCADKSIDRSSFPGQRIVKQPHFCIIYLNLETGSHFNSAC